MPKIGTIILAAGKGTRMKSDKPKVIFPLAGKPMINRVITTAEKMNSDLIAIVVGYKKDSVIDVIPENERIIFIEQKEQMGTGHAVMMCKDVFRGFNGVVFILCGDVPLLRHQTLEKMLKLHILNAANCTVLTAIMEDPAMYGRIVRNKQGNVSGIIEFKDADDTIRKIKEINTGIYCFNAVDLFQALTKIDNNNKQQEYYLTDTLKILNDSGKKVISVVLDDILEISGINSREQLQALEEQFLAREDHFSQ
jgi:bifunctional UDP-N-acetylglucosamine pyrophosphorylase / glucosamine-1-phosphate N-acetyltransferase